MPLIRDPRYGGGAVGEIRSLPVPVGAPAAPPLLDTLAAAARTATMPGAAYANLTEWDPDDIDPPDPSYDPLDDIAGYEDHARQFFDARTRGDVTGIKRRIDRELADRETLTRAGVGGLASEVVMNLMDPTFLASVAVPELALAKAGRVASGVRASIEGAAAASVYEFGMQNLQETRSGLESGVNIAGGALISGVLGATLSRRLPKPELHAAQGAGDEFVRSEAGAAAVARPTTLARESPAAGGDTFLKAAGKVPLAETDLQRVMRSKSIEAHKVMQDLVDVAPTLGKNLEGDITPTSVEALVTRREGAVADFVDQMGQQWRAYKLRELPVGEKRLTRTQFEEAVAGASRRGDKDLAPEVSKAASYLRERVFDPLKREAQKLKLLPGDGEIDLYAESYFRRMYDRTKIRAERPAWDRLLSDHYVGKGLDRAEADSLAEEITRRILGADVGVANFNVRGAAPDAGPLHERVLDIPDEQIERFLVNDPGKVADAYVRELAPQIEVTRRFGDKDMTDAISRIKDEYAIKRGKVSEEAGALDALQKEEQDVLEALLRMRDRLYARTSFGAQSRIGQNATNILRGWRNLVSAAKMGGVALTGGAQDLSRIMASYGFMPTLSRMGKLFADKEFRQTSKANARRIGAATEVALARRALVFSDGAVTEGWTQRMADGVYRLSGLNHVTDFQRTLTATLIEDKILASAAKVAEGGQITKAVRTHLASLGIDEDSLRAIAREAKKHGGELEGTRVSGSASWKDGRLAEIYDAAILKESRIAVMQPGLADRAWWADNEVGKTLGQIKSFVIAAPVRLAVTPVQLIGQGRYAHAARFIGFMMLGGYMAHGLRQLAAGKKPTTSPSGIAGEAFTESGLAGVLPDIVAPLARRTGWFGESARFSDRNVTSAIGGPAVGAFVDAYDVLYNRTQGGLSARDLQAARRLLPFQNLWWLRRGINALEGETAEALELQGATTQSIGERITQTQALLPTGQRGGTGTGAVL